MRPLTTHPSLVAAGRESGQPSDVWPAMPQRRRRAADRRRRARSRRRRTARRGSSGLRRGPAARGPSSCGPGSAGRRPVSRSCRRRSVRLHDAALLRHEHAPVGRELDRRRAVEARRRRSTPGSRAAASRPRPRGARHAKWPGTASGGAAQRSARTASAGARAAIESKSAGTHGPPGRILPSLEERPSANPATGE